MIEQNINKIKLIESFKNSIIENNLEKLQTILNENLSMNIDLELNDTPLIIYAAQHKYWDIFNELYSAGSNVNVKIETLKWSLIHECILSAPEKFAKALINDDDIDLNVQNKNGLTPLMLAIKERKTSCIDEIIKVGKFDIAKVDKNGNNVAHYAVLNEDYDLLVRLIKLKCSINVKNKNDETPYDLINDLQVKETLEGRVLKSEIKKEIAVTDIKNTEVETKVESKEEDKKGLSGLSKIKRK